MIYKKDIAQPYLQNYGEREVAIAYSLFSSKDKFLNVLCLPVFDEAVDDIARFIAFANNQPKTLVILIINQPISMEHSNSEKSTNNLLCHQSICEQYKPQIQSENISRHSLEAGSGLLVIDRYSPNLQIPIKQGVGLARKIAADIACQLIDKQFIQSNLIYSIDADVVLPNDYFISTLSEPINTAAFIYPFKHIAADNSHSSQQIHQSTLEYEQRLIAYTDGLEFAGSPYAFHTIGSTITINYRYYALVRGFPKRAAGEDFYLLNKLRKVGNIFSLTAPTIQIRSRISQRTPFGTGRAVDRLLNTNHTNQAENEVATLFYHPQTFRLLKIVLRWLDAFANQTLNHTKFASANQSDFLNALPAYWKESLNDHINLEEKMTNCSNKKCRFITDEDQHLIVTSLEHINFTKGLSHCIKQTSNATQFRKQMFYWFDAFRTLKWIHTVREFDIRYGNISKLEFLALTKPFGSKEQYE